MVIAGRLTVVGLGPGALDQITPEAAAALHAADDVVGYLPYVCLLYTSPSPRDD